jgi:hypothetical protein
MEIFSVYLSLKQKTLKTLFLVKKSDKIFETLDKKKQQSKKKSKTSIVYFFMENQLVQKTLKKQCRVNFEVREPYV